MPFPLVVPSNLVVTVNVHINFPALTDLVAYLKDRDRSQTQVNDLALVVESLGGRLKKSEDALDHAVQSSKEL